MHGQQNVKKVSNKIPSFKYPFTLSLDRHVVRPSMVLRPLNDPFSTPRTIDDWIRGKADWWLTGRNRTIPKHAHSSATHVSPWGQIEACTVTTRCNIFSYGSCQSDVPACNGIIERSYENSRSSRWPETFYPAKQQMFEERPTTNCIFTANCACVGKNRFCVSWITRVQHKKWNRSKSFEISILRFGPTSRMRVPQH